MNQINELSQHTDCEVYYCASCRRTYRLDEFDIVSMMQPCPACSNHMSAQPHLEACREVARYMIVDARGEGCYNDPTLYTREAAEVALVEAQRWAREEAKREPSWAGARLRIEEVTDGR